MTYDLFVLPIDRAMTADEVAAEVERRQRTLGFGRGHDRRLDPFLAALSRRYWQLGTRTAVPAPFELDVARSYVFVGIPWNRVDEVLGAVAHAAFASGVAVWDPQRELVGMPPPIGTAPLSLDGIEAHVDRAFREIAALGYPAMATPMREAAGGPGSEARLSASFRTGPGELDATRRAGSGPGSGPAAPGPDDGAPRSPERRDALIAALARGLAADRHEAVGELAAWDADPAVATALRPLLQSEDVYEATSAAAGLARQGDVTDLPALLDLVRRLSPADGASQSTMVGPLRSALALAAVAGPEIVDGVRARASAWRAAGGRRPAWDREHDAELDALLGD